MRQFKVGDRVGFSAAVKRSMCGLEPFGDERGLVTRTRAIGNSGRPVMVYWTSEQTGEEHKALASNLAIVGPNARYCAY